MNRMQQKSKLVEIEKFQGFIGQVQICISSQHYIVISSIILSYWQMPGLNLNCLAFALSSYLLESNNYLITQTHDCSEWINKECVSNRSRELKGINWNDKFRGRETNGIQMIFMMIMSSRCSMCPDLKDAEGCRNRWTPGRVRQ